jgi:PAS domain-containing protein
MSDHAVEPPRPADLRSRAASRLAGSAARKGSPAGITDALSALYTLATSPQTASDALALLHELQVHQVELDLQAQELIDSRAELESELRRLGELYDLQPVGCFTIDALLVVRELNTTGAAMLGIARDDGYGVHLGDFLSAGSKRSLDELARRAVAGRDGFSCTLQLCRPGQPEQPVHVILRAAPDARGCFVVFAEIGDEPAHASGAR